VTTATAIVTPQTVAVGAVSPSAPSVTVGYTQAFTATPTGGANNTVTWSATGGTWSGSTWTAPATPGTYTITATSTDDTSKSASTTVTVVAPVAITGTAFGASGVAATLRGRELPLLRNSRELPGAGSGASSGNPNTAALGAGVTVQLIQIDSTGAQVGAVIASAITDASGSYTLNAPADFVPGPSYVVRALPAGGTPIQGFVTGTSVSVDPYTQATVVLVTGSLNGAASLSNVTTSNITAVQQTVLTNAGNIPASATTSSSGMTTALKGAVTNNVETAAVVSSLAAPGGIQGTVTDTSVTPHAGLAGILVMVKDFNTHLLVAHTRTAADGTYSLHAPAGDYIVAAVNDGTASLAASSWWTLSGANTMSQFKGDKVSVAAADTSIQTVANFSLVAGGRISGLLTANDGLHTPLSGLQVALCDFYSSKTQMSVTTLPDGTMTFNVAPGDYYISVRNSTLQPYATASFNGAAVGGGRNNTQASRVTVKAGDKLAGSMVLDLGHLLSGTVTDPLTGPVPGISVRLQDADNGNAGGESVRTAKDGTYSIWVQPGHWNAFTRGQLANGLDLTTADLAQNFGAAVGVLQAKLVCGSLPASEVEVQVLDANNSNNFVGKEVSNADGSIELYVPGTVTSAKLLFNISNGDPIGSSTYDPATKAGVITAIPDATPFVPPTVGIISKLGTITLLPGAVLAGFVQDPSNNPLANVVVQVNLQSSNKKLTSVRTRSDGSYQVCLPSGSTLYKILANPQPGGSASAVVSSYQLTSDYNFLVLTFGNGGFQPLGLGASPNNPAYGGTFTLTPTYPKVVDSVTLTQGSNTLTCPASGTATAPITANWSGSRTYTLTFVAAGVTSVFTIPVTPQTVNVGTISPASVSMNTLSSNAFVVSVTGGVTNTVNWTVAPAVPGSFSSTTTASGVSTTWTAPASAGTYTITATAVDDPTKAATATVTVVAAPTINVAISPGNVSLNVNATQSFSATVTGGTLNTVTWSDSSGRAAGTVFSATSTASSVTTTWTAPATAGTYTITATSTEDATVVKTVTATVADANSVSISGTVYVAAASSGASGAPNTTPAGSGVTVGLYNFSDLATALATATTNGSGAYTLTASSITLDQTYFVLASNSPSGSINLKAFATATSTTVDPYTDATVALVKTALGNSVTALSGTNPLTLGTLQAFVLAQSGNFTPGTSSSAMSAALQAAVSNDSDGASLLASLAGTATLVGTVTDGSASPATKLAGALIEVRNFNDRSLAAQTRTDSNGHYSVHVAPGDYTLGVLNNTASSTAASAWWTSGNTATPTQFKGEKVSVAASATATSNFTLSTGYRISGAVQGAVSGAALSGIQVVFYHFSSGRAFASQRTGTDGSFNLCVPPGDYACYFRNTTAQAFAGGYYDGANPIGGASLDQAAKVPITNADLTTPTIILPTGHQLSGTVSSGSGGTHLANQVVVVTAVSGPGGSFALGDGFGGVVDRLLTNQDGTYRLWLLSGTYGALCRGQYSGRGDQTAIDLTADRTVDFTAATGAITATLVDNTGSHNPVGQVEAQLFDTVSGSNRLIARALSNADGTVTLYATSAAATVKLALAVTDGSLVASSTYSYNVSGSSGVFQTLGASSGITTPALGSLNALGTITLPTGIVVTGLATVTNAAQAGIPLQFQASGTGPNKVVTPRTRVDGSYQVSLPPSALISTIQATFPGNTNKSKTNQTLGATSPFTLNLAW